MDWKKKCKFHIRFAILFSAFLVVNLSLLAQDNSEENEEVIYDEEIQVDAVEVVADTVSSYDSNEAGYEVTQPPIETTDPVQIRKKEHWTEESHARAQEGISYTKEPKKEPEEIHRGDYSVYQPPKKNWFEKFFETRGAQIIILVLVISFLIYFLVRFLGERSSAKDKKLQLKEYSLDHLEENLEDSDLEQYLKLAVDSGDYRSAIRIFYLTIIRNLHDRKFITWKKEKTNFDYVRELRGNTHYNDFRNATRMFELVWYGNALIAEKEYRTVEPVFRRFIQSVQNGSKK